MLLQNPPLSKTKILHLTRIIISKTHPNFKGDSLNAHQRHNRIGSLFPNKSRVDVSALFKWEQDVVVVQSLAEPRFDLLPLHYTVDVETKLLPLEKVINSGQWLKFSLLADTSKKNEKNTKGPCRVPCKGISELRNWLERRIDNAATLGEVDINYGSRIPIQKEENRWVIRSVRYNGYLKVINPVLLANVISEGFGKSRSYGCGLMQLAPVRGVA